MYYNLLYLNHCYIIVIVAIIYGFYYYSNFYYIFNFWVGIMVCPVFFDMGDILYYCYCCYNNYYYYCYVWDVSLSFSFNFEYVGELFLLYFYLDYWNFRYCLDPQGFLSLWVFGLVLKFQV